MSEGRPETTGSQSSTRNGVIWLLGLLGAVSVLLAFGGESARLALRYERVAMLAGEYWRLATGHVIHLGTAHLVLNLAGLVLIGMLFHRDYTARQWLIVFAASALCIDVGFVLFEPQLQWYVGLSGVLHGALAAGAVAWWRHETRPVAFALIAVLAGKLAWEQWRGALPFSGDIPVIVDAHLYGAIGGLIAGLGIGLYLHGWSVRR